MTGAELLAAFLARSLTHEQWTHEAHITFRIALVKLNDVHGVPESPMRGYHETLTRAWLAVVAGASRHDPAPDSRAFLVQHPEMIEKTYLRRHSSPERMASVEARARFVEPDLSPLPL